ncbi:glutamate receptor 2.8 [Aegilops tauschii subsp. strangulata]|uniref:Glutamate receptor n=4 Tax=Aegilops tauschii subsp. strangulata TaxID=200361 RepID=A0A453KVU4_AEGTS|nr:glutamate receptor 2.8 [Aegilops tauschii subsp. strangulata]
MQCISAPKNLKLAVPHGMERTPRAILFLLLLLLVDPGVAQNTTGKADEFHVGVILNLGSLVGKVARTSISLAVQDFYAVHQNYSTKLTLHFRDSMASDVKAASAAIELLDNYKLQAIIGPQKSSEAVFISKIGNITQVPTVSFTATSPSLTSDTMPYFVRATLNDSAQVNSIASLVKAYGWREVVLVYENTDYGRGILPYLISALQESDVHVPYQSVIPPSATSEIMMQELYKLMTMQTRVFIVHMSSTMTSLLFTKAKEAGMMDKGFAWITTNGVANIIDSLNPSVTEVMNGVLGLRYHVPKSKELDSFSIRWNRMYQQDNPDESPFNKLSIVGLRAYDTIWALAQAAEKVGISSAPNKQPWSIKNSTCLESMVISPNGPKLLAAIVQNKFRGISGDFDLTDKQLKVSVFQIINVVGRGWREIGFWSVKSGLSRQLNQNGLKTTGSASMLDLNPVIWPGESTEIPRGWEIPISGKKLRVGVHTSNCPEFIKTFRDPVTNVTSASGLSVDIFEEAIKRLPFALTYEYLAFDTADTATTGSYNDFIYQVYLQKYDIAVGDITVRYNRSLYVDFTVPYTESGVGMIVPVKENMIKNMWIFLKPLSTGMWFGSIIFFIYTGVVAWLLEYLNGNQHVHGPFSLKQVGITMFFSIFEEKEKLERFLSRIVLLVWMFVFLVLTSSYTASFASMLTVQQLSPTVTDVHELQRKGEYVGFHRGSYIEGLLVDIGFEKSKMRPYETQEDFAAALSKGSKDGDIAALVHEIPYIKLFLAKYSKGYTMVGPIYKSAGFAFALPKQSPLRAEMSRAILNITGEDSINEIEKKWIYQNSHQHEDKIDGSGAITFESFGGLFLLTGIVTTCSLAVAMLMNLYKKYQENAWSKEDDQNECGHRQQGANGDSQEEQGDQNSNEHGNCSDIEKQTTLKVPLSSNTE